MKFSGLSMRDVIPVFTGAGAVLAASRLHIVLEMADDMARGGTAERRMSTKLNSSYSYSRDSTNPNL